jgi:hypothetical protein
MAKIKTNSLFEASIDSFRYRIPLSKVEVINSNVLDEMLHVKLNAVTGEILKETRATSQWLEITQEGYEIGFSKAVQFGCEFAVIKISSKLLEYRYLEGIKMQNIEFIYKKIISCNVFNMSFDTFLSEGLVTDIDLKKDVELSKDEFKKGKGSVFQQLYGKIEEKNLSIPYFRAIQDYIDQRWKYFKNNGYVDTPVYRRAITENHIKGAFANKVTNYILQAYETERNCEIMKILSGLLVGKKTIPILYSYDSILFDIHKSDGLDVIHKIKNIMETDGFPVTIKVGKDFHDMKIF